MGTDLPASDPWDLFDGRAGAALHAPQDTATLGVALRAPAPLAAIEILGPADGTLSVYALEKGELKPIDGLTNVNVHAKAGRWFRGTTADATPASRLVLHWTGSAGPSEVALWGLALPEREVADWQVADRLLAGHVPQGSRSSSHTLWD